MELNTQNFQSYEDNREVPEQLRILILEDNPADAELMQFELQEAGFDFRSELVDNKQSFLQALKKFSPDIILSDYDLPTYSGWEALQIRNNLYPDTPFILVTGALVEERAIEVLTNGATDYVLKHNLTKLSPAVHRALNEVYEHRKRKEAEEERDRAEEALKQREYLYRTLFNNTEDGLVLIEPIFTEMGNSDDYRILEVNDACERQTGLRAADLLGKRVREIMPKVEPIWTATFGEVAKSGVAKHIERYNTGSGRWFDVHALPYQRGQVVLLFRISPTASGPRRRCEKVRRNIVVSWKTLPQLFFASTLVAL